MNENEIMEFDILFQKLTEITSDFTYELEKMKNVIDCKIDKITSKYYDTIEKGFTSLIERGIVPGAIIQVGADNPITVKVTGIHPEGYVLSTMPPAEKRSQSISVFRLLKILETAKIITKESEK